MNREVIEFATNVPVELSLAFTDGKDISNKYGDQVMFTTTDNRVLFVPPIVRQKIAEAGIERGELFQLVKAEVKQGQRKLTQWQVIPYDQEPRQTQPLSAEQFGEKTDRESKSQPAAAAETVSNSASQSNVTAMPTANGNGHHLAKNASAGKGPELLQLALRAAIDLALGAENYAKSQNFRLQFTSEDVRCMANTLYIDAARNGNGGASWRQ